ncbi:hypothetical protein HC766_01960 [Candidatus Gracilibacteria bacterium]|nr:hypothetical protein [Candidatus Gracilibacteria bacterium]
MNNLVYKLNGKGEIFYRKIGLKERNIKKGYENKPWVIKGKRFTDSSTKDSKGKQFFFHFPITINAKKISGVRDGRPNGNAIKKVNEIFLNYLESESENLYYLGIDRGEKHLAYYCLVNSKGEIISQGSLNLPFVDKDGKPCSVNANIMISKDDGTFEIETVTCWNYNDLLEARAGNRDFARKNWQAIDSIKNLKNGYVSQVITEIIKNAVNLDNPKLTFIVLEDLNTGFKRSRIKIENQVYQKLELALAKKLNFYVNKKVESGVGSVTQALQLTPPVTNYQDIENKKQLGIMLYTRPNYTSVTDPVTGWRKSVYIQKGSEEKVKNQIIEKFTDITWEDGDYCFEYKDSNTNKIWKLYSGKNGKTLDRFRGKKNDHGKWEIKPINVKSILDEVFNEKEFDKNRSLLSQIVDEGKEISAIIDMGKWDSLRYAIDLIQQIRNIGNNERDQDFIFSPIRDNNGNYFDSREYWDKEKNNEKVDLPTCGDAMVLITLLVKV